MPSAGDETIVIIKEIGPVYLHHNRRARRITIRIGQEGAVKVTVPRDATVGVALDFVLQKTAWIAAQQAALREPRPEPALPYEPPPLTREEATGILTRRVGELAALHHIAVTRIAVRDQRTLWGSSSSGGRISINYRAARLPDHLRDYVILHELAHVGHHHHGPAFWRALDRLTEGAARALDREMRRWPLRLL